MSTIRDGELAIYRTAGGEAERIAIEGGFAEVGENGLTVLAEKADVAA
jgi:F-type H+-transporting ATPase subunit epsilon